jgi:cytochrome c oxidase assembly protein subunit 15
MGGQLVPPDFFGIAPWWANFTGNPPAVQFIHRVLAITTGLVLFALAYRLRATTIGQPLRRVATALAAIVLLQIGLGIETVLNQVPVWLGALHQANAILLLGVVVRVLYLLRAPRPANFRPRVVASASA